MGYVKNMVGDHEDRLREMDCNMARLRLELVELQRLREGFKHFIVDHWLPLIQYLHSFPNTQCSCGTDARDGVDSVRATLPYCSQRDSASYLARLVPLVTSSRLILDC